MADKYDVLDGLIKASPKKIALLFGGFALLLVLVIIYVRSIPRTEHLPSSSQQNNGNQNQGSGTNNGKMYQYNK